jgi:orotate phosphoribosyltransferase
MAGKDIPFAYNRKEAKDHGEGGVLVADAEGDGGCESEVG